MSRFMVPAAASLCLAMASVAWAQGTPDESPLGHLGIGNEPSAPSSFDPPEGWRPSVRGDGVTYYDAPDVPSGKCWIAAFPREHLGGRDFRTWYDAQWMGLQAKFQEKGLVLEEGRPLQWPAKDGSDVLDIFALASRGNILVKFTAANKGGWAQGFVYLVIECGSRATEGASALSNIGGGLVEIPLPKQAEEMQKYSRCMNRCALEKKLLCTETYAGVCDDQYVGCTSSC